MINETSMLKIFIPKRMVNSEPHVTKFLNIKDT